MFKIPMQVTNLNRHQLRLIDSLSEEDKQSLCDSLRVALASKQYVIEFKGVEFSTSQFGAISELFPHSP